MDFEKLLLTEKNKTERLVGELTRNVEYAKTKAGDNKIRCGESHECFQYYIDGRYVSAADKRSMELIKNRVSYEYLSRILRIEKIKLYYLTQLNDLYKKNDEDKIYTDLPAPRKHLVTPVLPIHEESVNKWISEKYVGNEKWENTTEFYTIRGEHVRSKAEKMIADELNAYGIPYRYEYPHVLYDGNIHKTIYPDFTVLNKRTLREFVIEHLGMMDKVNYYNKNLDKIDFFEKNGYLIGVNLLILHETSENPLSVAILRKYIEEFLL